MLRCARVRAHAGGGESAGEGVCSLAPVRAKAHERAHWVHAQRAERALGAAAVHAAAGRRQE